MRARAPGAVAPTVAVIGLPAVAVLAAREPAAGPRVATLPVSPEFPPSSGMVTLTPNALLDESAVLDYICAILQYWTSSQIMISAAKPKEATTASRKWSGAELGGPALRTFFRIADAWQLSAEEARRILGDPPRSTFFLWKRTGEGQLPRDTLERVSYILGIYKALQILLPQKDAADTWVRRPNSAPLFGGKPAVERMLSGNVADLYVVRQYLDAQRGGSS